MRSVNRQVSFADLELEKQGVAMEPALQTISNFLDDNREIIEKIGADLRRGLMLAAARIRVKMAARPGVMS